MGRAGSGGFQHPPALPCARRKPPQFSLNISAQLSRALSGLTGIEHPASAMIDFKAAQDAHRAWLLGEKAPLLRRDGSAPPISDTGGLRRAFVTPTAGG